VQFLGANTLDDKPFIVMPYVQHNAKDFLRTRSTFDPLYIVGVHFEIDSLIGTPRTLTHFA
jgi:hypothetical protein